MNNLDILRQEIDTIDDRILDLFAKRLDLVKKVGEYKKENNLPIKNVKREDEILQKKIAQAEKLGLTAGFIKKIWSAFFEESYIVEK